MFLRDNLYVNRDTGDTGAARTPPGTGAAPIITQRGIKKQVFMSIYTDKLKFEVTVQAVRRIFLRECSLKITRIKDKKIVSYFGTFLRRLTLW